jgi:hypothetical protein
MLDFGHFIKLVLNPKTKDLDNLENYNEFTKLTTEPLNFKIGK